MTYLERLPRKRSLRGRIVGWLEAHADLLRPPIVEFGSCRGEPGWWQDFRGLVPAERVSRCSTAPWWVGIDIRPGPGVDLVVSDHDIETASLALGGPYKTALCCEVLEHARSPKKLLEAVRCVLEPDSWLLVTVPFAFPIHGEPGPSGYVDRWRFTPLGLTELLRDAGFVDIETAEAGWLRFSINDHGEARDSLVQAPLQVFAVARVP